MSNKPLTNFTDKQFNREQSMRRYHFAKFCWDHRTEVAPSGDTWRVVFERKEGLTLDEFRKKVEAYRNEK